MSRYRRLVLLLLGVGACLVLVLQTLGSPFWGSYLYTTSRPRLKPADQSTHPDDQTYVSPGEVQTKSLAFPEMGVSPADASPPTDGAMPKVISTVKPTPSLSESVRPSEMPVEDSGPSVQEIFQQAKKENATARNNLKAPKSILGPEQLLQIMGSAIGGLPIQNPRKVMHVLVTTYFRSGSTFLGDILQQNWKTFYHFEPLHHMSDGLRIKESQVPEALSLLRNLMTCNFTSSLATKYLLWTSDQKNTFLMRRNRFLWVACRMQPQLCFRPDFVRFICIRSPWQVMKVNRLSLEQVGQFVNDNPDLDVRVLHLVRDPRGIISSRKVLGWCNTTSCSDFRVLCNEMSSDYEAFKKLQKLKPDRFFELRYEDLSIKPQETARHMFGSLSLPYTNTVGKFLKLNTKARPVDIKDPYSTRRDSSRTPFEWRKKLKVDEIKKIQIGCASVLKNYNYGMVNSSEQLNGDPRKLYASGLL